MNIVLWIIAGLLAAAFAVSGVTKLVQPKEKLATNMTWVEDFSDSMIKVIGALELLAAIGLVLPAVVGIAPVLVPLAALGLVLVMVGAAITHGRRGEYSAIAINAVFLVLAAVVAWGRFGPYSFAA
ncbi:DoxX family protein [Lentzea tibetensis]|uniref:DoxX family protein n=1 Tax=Lentzea tibetensis TaxID=2591470 RepID=A0A563EX04_9PSEU|nr:DoxX family protein [Lentzea tibetensis]TWP52011.1 DoxX family protein [Lentzea tibetensis]